MRKKRNGTWIKYRATNTIYKPKGKTCHVRQRGAKCFPLYTLQRLMLVRSNVVYIYDDWKVSKKTHEQTFLWVDRPTFFLSNLSFSYKSCSVIRNNDACNIVIVVYLYQLTASPCQFMTSQSKKKRANIRQLCVRETDPETRQLNFC